MKRLTFDDPRARRLAAHLRLIDVAYAARCAPATVRCFEFGAPVRPEIEARLWDAYGKLCPGPVPTGDAS